MSLFTVQGDIGIVVLNLSFAISARNQEHAHTVQKTVISYIRPRVPYNAELEALLERDPKVSPMYDVLLQEGNKNTMVV